MGKKRKIVFSNVMIMLNHPHSHFLSIENQQKAIYNQNWRDCLKISLSVTWIAVVASVSCLWEYEVTQSCPTLCDPTDCSLPGFSVHGIFQARVLEWVAISFSRYCSVIISPQNSLGIRGVSSASLACAQLWSCIHLVAKLDWNVHCGLSQAWCLSWNGWHS